MEMNSTAVTPPVKAANKNTGVIIALAVLVIAGGLYWLMQGSKVETPLEPTSQVTITPEPTTSNPTVSPTPDPALVPPTDVIPSTTTPPQEPSAIAPANPETTIKSFTVTGGNFTFSPNQMTVKKGDTVKITFVNDEGFHDLVIDEFNVRTTKLAAGKSETVEFVADKTGGFEFYCSVGTHRQMGMKGTLVVE